MARKRETLKMETEVQGPISSGGRLSESPVAGGVDSSSSAPLAPRTGPVAVETLLEGVRFAFRAGLMHANGWAKGQLIEPERFKAAFEKFTNGVA